MKGSKQIIQQQRYHAQGLLQALTEIIKGLGALLFNPEAESPTEHNPDQEAWNQSEPLPINQTNPNSQQENRDSEIDWSQIKLIVLAAEQDVGILRGGLRRRALSLSVGPLRRKLAEVTFGKAGLDLVAERLTPQRFQAVVNAADISPEPVTLIVLIARRDFGFAKGLVAKKLEGVLVGKFKEAPVEMIFERAHSADYIAVLNALQVRERKKIDFARCHSTG